MTGRIRCFAGKLCIANGQGFSVYTLSVCRCLCEGSGLGQMILSFIKGTFFGASKVGCRYLTVDAYLDAENFYTKCNFSPLVIPEPGDETVLMFFDLMSMEQ